MLIRRRLFNHHFLDFSLYERDVDDNLYLFSLSKSICIFVSVFTNRGVKYCSSTPFLFAVKRNSTASGNPIEFGNLDANSASFNFSFWPEFNQFPISRRQSYFTNRPVAKNHAITPGTNRAYTSRACGAFFLNRIDELHSHGMVPFFIAPHPFHHFFYQRQAFRFFRLLCKFGINQSQQRAKQTATRAFPIYFDA